MNDTSASPPRQRLKVRRDAVLGWLPKDVDRSATGVGKYFRISRSTAWRLFFAPEFDESGKPTPNWVSAESVYAIKTKLSRARFDSLFELAPDSNREDVAESEGVAA